MSTLDLTLEPKRGIRRIEVIDGIGGRRRWSMDDKARLVEETLVPGAVVSDVARRHGLTPQQLFTWRREARQRPAASEAASPPMFVPAVVEPAVELPPEPSPRRRTSRPARKAGGVSGVIEVEIDGVTVRVGRGAESKTVAAVIRALKAGA